MKKSFLLSIILIAVVAKTKAQTNYLDSYIGAVVTPTIIASSANQVDKPTDLDFRPNSHDLWVLNYGTPSGGSNVIIYNAGLANQTMEYRMDTHTGHFMIFPSAMAFGNDGFWANTNEIQNTSSPTSTFMGPSLWTSDTAIFAKVFQNPWTPGLPLGCHYDMLHQSPFGMGIAHDSALVYWVYDGYNGNICKYDYVKHHGPGYDNHSAGKIWRYTDVMVTRVADIPSHMVLDKAGGWLYFIEGGSKKIKRMNINSGAITGSLTVPMSGSEPLASYQKVEGATVQTLDSLITQPCGIDYHNNRLIVSDYTNGNIYIYNTTSTVNLIGTIVTGIPGMMGVKVGPDGKIWCANKTLNNIYRLDIPNPSIDLAVAKITSPSVQNFKSNFYSTQFSICNGSITPSVTIQNTGLTTVTSATIIYYIDNGTSVSFNWNGTLVSGASTTVALPLTSSIPNGSHLLTVKATMVNGAPDMVALNNTIEGAFRTIDPIVINSLQEDFTTTTFPPLGWNYINYNPNNIMDRVTVSGFGLGTGSVKMDNFSGAEDISGQIDYLLTPRVDLTTASSGALLKFNVAYAQYASTSNDELQVLASTDCGITWTPIYQKAGAILSTVPPFTSAWTPTPNEWRTDVIPLTNYAGQSDVLFAFAAKSNFGNNLYIDDVQVNQTPTNVNSVAFDDLLTISPNPIETNVRFEMNGKFLQGAEGKIYSFDGKTVRDFRVPSNSTSFNLDLSTLSKGIYVVSINTGNNVITKRIIKE